MDVAPLVPFVVLGLALGLPTAWLERTRVSAQGAEWDLTRVERVLVALRAARRRLRPALLFFAATLGPALVFINACPMRYSADKTSKPPTFLTFAAARHGTPPPNQPPLC